MSNNSIKYDAVFFCSAFNDITFVLHEIERNNYSNYLIYITNNVGVYNFFLTIRFNRRQLRFVKSKLMNPRNPFDWIIEYFNLRLTLHSHLCRIDGSKIFLSATYYDIVSMYSAGVLKERNKLFILSTPGVEEFVLTNQRLFDKLLSVLLNVPICTFISVGRKVSGLNLNFIQNFISATKKRDKFELLQVQSKYLYSLPFRGPFILILCSKDDDGIQNFYNSTVGIFNKILSFKDRFKLVFKFHPRLGPPSFFNNNDLEVLPLDVPLEFLDLKNCSLVIGTNSIALSNLAEKGLGVVSLLNLMEFYSEIIRVEYINYLKINNPKLSINYPSTLEELSNLITNI